MTPKEKAKQMFEKYFDMKWQSYNKRKISIKSMTKSAAKQCAIIALNEILDLMDRVATTDYINFRGTETNGYVDAQTEEEYWMNVKIELEKL